MMSFTEWVKQKKQLKESTDDYFSGDYSFSGDDLKPRIPQGKDWTFSRDSNEPRTQQKPQPQQPRIPKEPKEGDLAYSRYKQRERVGKLLKCKNCRPGVFELVIDRKEDWIRKPHEDSPVQNQNIRVGDGESIRWDAKKNMWYAPAKMPNLGDRAYSIYDGKTREGFLWNDGKTNHYMVVFQLVVPEGQPWFSDPNQHLWVGSDEDIVWDDQKNMWYAPADYD